MNEQAQGHHNAEEARERDAYSDLLDSTPARLKQIQYHLDAAEDAIAKGDGEELEAEIEELQREAGLL